MEVSVYGTEILWRRGRTRLRFKGKADGEQWNDYRAKGLLECAAEGRCNGKEQEQRQEMTAGGTQTCFPRVPWRGPARVRIHLVAAGGDGSENAFVEVKRGWGESHVTVSFLTIMMVKLKRLSVLRAKQLSHADLP